MKNVKVILILGSVLLVLFVLNLRFKFIETLSVQFSEERYAKYISKIDYEKELLKEPLCISDMAGKDKPLQATELSETIRLYDYHKQLNEKYGLSSVASAENDFDKAVQLLNWLTQHTFYSGMQMRLLKDDALDILEYSFDKPFRRAINCRYRAIAFADCLVAVGIKAFPVAMVSSGFTGSHFTCMVYISENDKWCCFDPSFGCWFTNEDGELLDIFEIRELFLQNEQPVVKNYSFNGKEENFDVYINLFMKMCASNLSTWKDNSPDRRNEKSFSGRKQFGSLIPFEAD